MIIARIFSLARNDTKVTSCRQTHDLLKLPRVLENDPGRQVVQTVEPKTKNL